MTDDGGRGCPYEMSLSEQREVTPSELCETWCDGVRLRKEKENLNLQFLPVVS